MLIVYMGSIVFSYSANLIIIKALKKQAKKRGYKFKIEEKNSILNKLKLFGVCSIPIYNVVLTSGLILISLDRKNPVIEDMIKDGELIKIENNNVEEPVVNVKNDLIFEGTKIVREVNPLIFENNNINNKQKVKLKRR